VGRVQYIIKLERNKKKEHPTDLGVEFCLLPLPRRYKPPPKGNVPSLTLPKIARKAFISGPPSKRGFKAAPCKPRPPLNCAPSIVVLGKDRN